MKLECKIVERDGIAQRHLARSAEAGGFQADYYDPELCEGSMQLVGGFIDGERVLTWGIEWIGSKLWVAAVGGDGGWSQAGNWLSMIERAAKRAGATAIGMNTRREGLKRLYMGSGYQLVSETGDVAEFEKVFA